MHILELGIKERRKCSFLSLFLLKKQSFKMLMLNLLSCLGTEISKNESLNLNKKCRMENLKMKGENKYREENTFDEMAET